MVLVVAPLLQRLPKVALDVNTVEPSEHKVLLPEILGVAGAEITLTTKAVEAALVQVPTIERTV
jgi:hypothetical protein